MGTVEIITIGGGQHLVAIMNAVAAWTGGGGFRGLLQVVMVIGLGYALLTMAMNLNWKVLYQWFVSSTLMYACLIVPTTTLVITDKISPATGNGSVANVPVGLAIIASMTSQANFWLTSTAETIFVEPGNLTMSGYGVVYPLRLLDAAKSFTIQDPQLKANVEGYIDDCYILAVMTNPQGTTVTPFNQLAGGDILTGLGPGSPARYTQWVDNTGASNSMSCDAAYQTMRTALQQASETYLRGVAKVLYPDITDANTAYNKIVADVPAVTSGMFGTSMTASSLYLQRSLTDAFMEARGNLGGAQGDTFAVMRADVQARNTMSMTARQALIWVPVLDLVLTIVFYAMFPLIFPLMLLPGGGVQVLKGYVGGFFYLISWGSVSAVLHMFVVSKAAAQMVAATGGVGLTMANLAELDGLNGDSAAMAGYLLMSVPVIAGGLAKGAMALSHSAGGMLAPVSAGADAAALERTTGNYGYNNVSANQFNTQPRHLDGAPTWTSVMANGSSMTRTANGSMVYDNSGAISKFGFSATQVESEMQSLSSTAAQFHNQANGFRSNAAASRQAATSHVNSVISGFSASHGTEGGSSTASESAHRQDAGTGARSEVSDRVNDTSSMQHGKSNTSSTTTSKMVGGRVGLNGDISASGGKGIAGKISLGGGAFGQVTRDWRNAATSDTAANDRSSAEHGEGVSTYKSGNDTWSFNESGLSRNGTFYRYSDLNESRQSLEKSFRDAKSYEEAASFSDEKGYRLDKVVSDTKQNGWQISEDMSQVIASRYHEVASSEKYAGMGAPSLQNVNPSAHQAAVRREIVSDIMRDYALEGSAEGAGLRQEVEGGVQAVHPKLSLPSASSVETARTHIGRPAVAGPGKIAHESAPADGGIQDAREQIGQIRHGMDVDAKSTRGKEAGLNGSVERDLHEP
jgi:conjugal transfer mating pair stabilization protein TraG